MAKAEEEVEVEMKRHLVTLAAIGVVSLAGTAIAQDRLNDPAAVEEGQAETTPPAAANPRMMGGMMPGMMGGMMPGRGRMGGTGMIRMAVILLDSDGDGALSLAEVQAVQERMFNAADSNADGRLTPEELGAMAMEFAGPRLAR